MCFGCSKEPKHMFWLRNKKNSFHLRTVIWGPSGVLDLGSSEGVCLCVYYSVNIYSHMETGPRLRVSSDRLEERGIKLGT